tara:strand:- start:225 stop:383 length:159 start_codon:yes stop_codon:yes gene_type:complete
MLKNIIPIVRIVPKTSYLRKPLNMNKEKVKEVKKQDKLDYFHFLKIYRWKKY